MRFFKVNTCCTALESINVSLLEQLPSACSECIIEYKQIKA